MNSPIGVGVKLGCESLHWLFDIFIFHVYEGNESLTGECRCKTEDEWNGMGPVCK